MRPGAQQPAKGGVNVPLLVIVTLALVAVIGSLAIPAVTSGPVRGDHVRQLNNARQFQIAAQTMALDGVALGDPRLLWPADSGVTSLEEYCDRMVEGRYLTQKDLEMLAIEEHFVVTNLSKEDRPDTAFVLSKAYFQTDPPKWMPNVVVFQKGGEGNFARGSEAPFEVVLPDREPALLPAD